MGTGGSRGAFTVSSESLPSEPVVTTRPKSREQTQTRRVPPYNVILENDDYHSFEFVVEVLCKALGCSKERSFQLTLQAHHSGRAVIWSGPKEVAELKVEQISTFHEVRDPGKKSLGPLSCTIEPAPGG
jgi:ATP-dependent Clp protease adaptor protein ClpS